LTRVAVAFLLGLSFVLASNDGSATIGIIMFANQQVQSQRDYLPSLDLSINQAKQQRTTLHIGTHILSESSKDNTQVPHQTRYQLNSHLQSNTLELDDKALPRAQGCF
jgi:hypothetical protein